MLDRTVPPPIHSISFTFRKPVEHLLRNGIPIYILQAQGLDAVRIDFVFSAGQWHQARKLQALFACRMLREGCRGYTAAEFAERLDYYGAWLELSVAMNRTFVTLYTLKKHFAATMELMHRMLTEPAYDEEQLRIVCANNKAQLMVNLQKGDVLAMRALRHQLYGPGHPCGVQVEPEDYDTLQVSDVVDYYRSFYGSRACRIYLSGDVDDTQLSLVESLFGSVEWGSGDGIETLKVRDEIGLNPGCNESAPSVVGLQIKGAVQDSLRMGCLLMDINSPDYLPMRVLVAILGGYFGSRLMKNVRETKGYTYHIGADLVTNTSEVMLLIHSEIQAGKADEVMAEVCHEMRRLQHEPVPEAELCMVRNYMLGEICRNYESTFSLADAYIFMEHLGLPFEHLEHTIEAIRGADAAGIMQLAQRYFCPEKLHAVVVGA